MQIKKCAALIGAMMASLAIVFSSAAIAEAYPTRPVKLMVGFSAGSATDILARIIGPKLSEMWGQPVVVENRPGAGGNLAASITAKATPDGYTLLFSNNGISIAPSLYKNLSFDARSELKPVALVARMPHILCVDPALPVKTVGELIALARSKPTEIMFTSAGVGNSDHMAAELFTFQTNLKLTHVPNKGSPEALNDVMSGRIAFYFAGLSTGLPQVEAGRVRGLAVTTSTRSAKAPSIPTMKEAGLPDYDVGLWNAVFAPARTPAAIVDKIAQDLLHALDDKTIRERALQLGIEVSPSGPAEFERFFASELDRWAKVIQANDLQIK